MPTRRGKDKRHKHDMSGEFKATYEGKEVTAKECQIRHCPYGVAKFPGVGGWQNINKFKLRR